jgi:hypothetical protein
MTLYRLEMSQAVRNLITHLPPELKRKVKCAFRAIAADPYQAKELKDDLVGLRSYRLGNARIIKSPSQVLPRFILTTMLNVLVMPAG